MLNTVILVIDVLAALFLILTILLHSGKGSGLSDLFGGGSTLSGGTSLAPGGCVPMNTPLT